jgi:hypothetical protein
MVEKSVQGGFVTAEELYELIYQLAPDMQWTQEELEGLLCNADEIAAIGTHDLHKLVYGLAEKGLLDEDSLNNYLAAADRIAGRENESPD